MWIEREYVISISKRDDEGTNKRGRNQQQLAKNESLLADLTIEPRACTSSSTIESNTTRGHGKHEASTPSCLAPALCETNIHIKKEYADAA